MASNGEIETAKSDAQVALFKQITAEVGTLAADGGNSSYRSSVLRELATAYRLTAGGPQPGSPTVTK